ncbi:MAG: hypothetical protein U1C46_08300 [Bacteroidales bacterium]|nr:hypothetical protein [Bacteroidales bacterium]
MTRSFKKLEKLVNKKLENSLTTAEQQDYEELLAGAGEARIYAEQMEILHASMQESDFKRQQIDLSKQIMDRIENATRPGTSPKPFLLSHFPSIKQQFVKYAALFIFGILLGSAITFVLISDEFRPTERFAKGTFSAQAGGSLFYKGDDWQILASSVIIDKEVYLYVSIGSENELQVNMRFDPQVYTIENLKCHGCSLTPEANINNGQVRFIARDEIVLKVLLKYLPGMGVPIDIMIGRNGVELYQGKIIIR